MLARIEADLCYAAKSDRSKGAQPQLQYLNHSHAAQLRAVRASDV